jgi:hypothetical protein
MNGSSCAAEYSAPPSGGPTIAPTAYWACCCAIAVGSCAFVTTCGRAEVSASRKKTAQVPSTNDTITSCAIVKVPRAATTAILASAIALIALHRTIVTLRFQRSTSAPASRVNSRYGRLRAAATNPACAGECVSASTSSGKAICDTCVPMIEIVCPLHSSMQSRFFHNGMDRSGWVVSSVRIFPPLT